MNTKLLSLSIGGAHISSNGFFKIIHSEKQKEYLEYKISLVFGNKEINKIKSMYKNGKLFYTYEKGIFNKAIKGEIIRKKLYGVFGHKYFSKYIVQNMDLFSFAILYLDSGNLCVKKRNGKIHGCDLVISIFGKKDECIRLIEKLNLEWKLKFTLKINKGQYSIRCGTKEAKKFLELIKPLIPEFKCFKDNKMNISK